MSVCITVGIQFGFFCGHNYTPTTIHNKYRWRKCSYYLEIVLSSLGDLDVDITSCADRLHSIWQKYAVEIIAKRSIQYERQHIPLLAPSGPRSIVHSSMLPNGANNSLTSSSDCCLLSIPTNSFRSVWFRSPTMRGAGGGMCVEWGVFVFSTSRATQLTPSTISHPVSDRERASETAVK